MAKCMNIQNVLQKVGHISITWKNSLSLHDAFQIILAKNVTNRRSARNNTYLKFYHH